MIIRNGHLAGIEAIDDCLLVRIELLERRAVLVQDLLVAVVDVWAGVDHVAAGRMSGVEQEPGVASLVRLRPVARQGSESFEGTDQRPPLRRAEWSKLGTEEENADLVAGPGCLRHDLEPADGGQRRDVGSLERSGLNFGWLSGWCRCWPGGWRFGGSGSGRFGWRERGRRLWR